MKKRLIIATICLSLSFLIAGCGKEEVDPNILQVTATTQNEEDLSYLNGLENNTFYIRHADNTFEKLSFEETSFDFGDYPKGVSKEEDEDIGGISELYDRMYWFNPETYEEIPTLYVSKGDTIIYYTDTELLDTFYNLERYKDLSYTIGLRNFYIGNTGRVSISTDPDDYCTYPDSDADAVIEIPTDSVVIDSIETEKLRAVPKNMLNTEENEKLEKELKSGSLTIDDYGIIENLQKDEYYNVYAYGGTVEYLYNLQCNIHAFGSFEIYPEIDYIYTNKYIITLQLPENLKDGYYSLNGEGLFRFLNTKEHWNEKPDDFNIPYFIKKEVNKDEDDDMLAEYEEKDEFYEEENKKIKKDGAKKALEAYYADEDKKQEENEEYETKKSKFKIEKEGKVTAVLELTGNNDLKNNIQVRIEPPSGDDDIILVRDADNNYQAEFYAIAGEYTITIENIHKSLTKNLKLLAN